MTTGKFTKICLEAVHLSALLLRGLSSCVSQALESRFSSLGARGLVALWHVGSSRTRAWSRVPCIGRWILNHCATREVPILIFLALRFKRKKNEKQRPLNILKKQHLYNTQNYTMKRRFPSQRKLLYFSLNQYFIFQMKMVLFIVVF